MALFRKTLLLSLALGACSGPEAQLIDSLAVVNWYPSGNAPCVPRDTGIWVTFSDELDPRTVQAGTVALHVGETVVAATSTYDADTRSIALQPEAPLQYGVVYTVVIDSGLGSMNGTFLPATVRSRFRVLPQSGCADDAECWVDGDCQDNALICSVTSTCVTGCVLDEDCPPGLTCDQQGCY